MQQQQRAGRRFTRRRNQDLLLPRVYERGQGVQSRLPFPQRLAARLQNAQVVQPKKTRAVCWIKTQTGVRLSAGRNVKGQRLTRSTNTSGSHTLASFIVSTAGRQIQLR